MKWRDVVDVSALSLVSGSGFCFIKLVVEEISPLWMTTGRSFFGVLFVGMILLFQGKKLPRWSFSWVHFLIMGVLCSAIPSFFFGFGEQRVGSGLAAIINGSIPLMTALMAHWFLEGETLTPMKVTGLLLGCVGLSVLVFPVFLQEGISGDVSGIVSVCLASLSVSAAIVYARKIVSSTSPVEATVGMLMTSLVYLVPLHLVIDRPWTLSWPSPAAMGALVVLGVATTGLSCILYYRIAASLGATGLAAVNYTTPPVGALLGVLFFSETAGIHTCVAIAILVVAMALVNAKRSSSRVRAIPAVDMAEGMMK